MSGETKGTCLCNHESIVRGSFGEEHRNLILSKASGGRKREVDIWQEGALGKETLEKARKAQALPFGGAREKQAPC